MPSLRLTDAVPTVDPEQIIDQIKNITANSVFAAVATAVVSFLVVRVLLSFLDRALSRTKIEAPLRKLIHTLLRAGMIFLALILVLRALGIDVTSLVAVLSVIGLAFSLAMQNFLSNVAGGMQIFASQPFKLDDWVEIGDVVGRVSGIDMFYTKINTLDNRVVNLPNSVIVTQTIYNRNTEPYRQLEFKPTTSYDAPVQLVMDTLRAIACGDPRVLTDRGITVHVSKYGDSAIEYVLRMWCKNEDYWDIYFDVMDTLKPTFDAAGIEITYPHLNVHIADNAAPNLTVPAPKEEP